MYGFLRLDFEDPGKSSLASARLGHCDQEYICPAKILKVDPLARQSQYHLSRSQNLVEMHKKGYSLTVLDL